MLNIYVEPTSKRGNILESHLAFIDVQIRQQLDLLNVSTISSDKGKSIVCFCCKKTRKSSLVDLIRIDSSNFRYYFWELKCSGNDSGASKTIVGSVGW